MLQTTDIRMRARLEHGGRYPHFAYLPKCGRLVNLDPFCTSLRRTPLSSARNPHLKGRKRSRRVAFVLRLAKDGAIIEDLGMATSCSPPSVIFLRSQDHEVIEEFGE